MIIRTYLPSDCEEMAALFYQTVHTVNAVDYTKEQLDAWATGTVDLADWNLSFLEHFTVVAVEEDRVVTHASITAKGFFEHRGYQVEKEQQVMRNGVSLTNYRMVKETAGSQGTKVKEEDL